jgi:hypothetical protein
MDGPLFPILAIAIFLGWLALYLIVLRPLLLDTIMNVFGLKSISFPAILHLIPIFGTLIVVGLIGKKVFK